MTPRVLAQEQVHQLAVIRKSASFDAEWYKERYPDVQALGIEADFHYVWIGAPLGRDPSPHFNTRAYLKRYPDVADSGLNAFFHYISAGQREGRSAVAANDQVEIERTTDARAQYRIDRVASIGSEEDWLLFVAYSPDGRLSDCQKRQIESFKSAGYRIALILNSDDFSNPVDPGAVNCDIQVVRENIGFDFGAWRHAIELCGSLERAQSLTFTNDSILPVGGKTAVTQLRRRIAEASSQVVFMTENLEVKRHVQSYLFCLRREALEAGALSILADIPYYLDKDALIHEVEMQLGERLLDSGYSICTLFPMPEVEDNPTIHHWETLLEAGLPFLKIQLVTSGILCIDDPRLTTRLEETVHRALREHGKQRRRGGRRKTHLRNMPLVPALKIAGRFDAHGAQQAFNLPSEQNPTLFVPLRGIANLNPEIPRILAVIHAFYTDLSFEILAEIASIRLSMRLLITTDSSEKARTITEQLRTAGLEGEIVVCPNRGRDLAPFLIEAAAAARDADVILHLHTKKSPHDEVYAGWGSYLRRNLIGSTEIVQSILRIFDETDVGFIYSDHFPEVLGLRNWGFDYDHASSLLGRLDIRVDADTPLEFPTSSMFWARREALEPLFGLGLQYEDFEAEAGQIDGTLAHAIERSFLYVAQSQGLAFTKVTSFDRAAEANSPLLRLSVEDLTYAFNRPAQFLLGDSVVRSDFCRAVPEVYPVGVVKSRREKLRLNVLLPTMKPEKIYGGITTALKTIDQLLDSLPADVDVRVLITSDTVDAASVRELSRRLDRSFFQAMPDDDVTGDTIVGVAEFQHVPISLRARELYVATAWWTADLGYRLLDRQRDIHGRAARLAYIIQDFEPGFYNWSNTFALAEATYHRGDETAAIINSEELTSYVLDRYKFAQTGCIPYELHPRLAEMIEPTEPAPLILVYGRPGVSRNCFELLVEGLRLWQARDPSAAKSYEIIFAGEDFAEDRIAGLTNARNAGKMPIEDYARALNRAAVGVSLMVSPHPSYPPLEMASAGCITITNRYEGKDLSRRAKNILSLESLTPHCLATCLEEALSRVRFGQLKNLPRIKPLKSKAANTDYDRIAEWLVNEK